MRREDVDYTGYNADFCGHNDETSGSIKENNLLIRMMTLYHWANLVRFEQKKHYLTNLTSLSTRP